MKNRVHNLSKYVFNNNESFLLDTNIWLYLFPAPSRRSHLFEDEHCSAFKKMMECGVRLMMDVMVISEYLNAYCRIEKRAVPGSPSRQFKDFRNSGVSATALHGATSNARRIMKMCSCHDHPFSQTDVTRILEDFEAGKEDFNDGLLAETCRIHHWKLVTNDSDFTEGGIDILTINPKLLDACV